MSILSRLSILFLLLFGYGCATVINGTTQKIPIASDPSGAKCIVVGQATDLTTPCEVELKRKEDHVIKIEKQGFETATVEIKHVLSGAVAGNILLGGLIGWGVDAANGSQNRLIPETVNVTLKVLPPPPLPVQPEAASTPEKEAVRKKTPLEELDELDQMKKDHKISDKEYKIMRKKIVDRY